MWSLTTPIAIDVSNVANAVPTSRTISTSGTGLSGGGDLTADRTITLDPSALAGDVAFDALGAIPTGGATGQVLAKASGTNYDTAWGAPQLAGGAARPLNTAGAFLDGTNGLVLSGIAGNNASSPDSAALDITGDIDIKAKLTLANWAPGSGQTVVAKFASIGQRSFAFFVLTAGALRFQFSSDGTNNTAIDSTVATGLASGTTKWVRATMDADDGAGNKVVKFYLSDDGAIWTQLGTTSTTAGVASIFNSTSPLEVGSAGGALILPGTHHRLLLQSAFDTVDNTTSVAFDADFAAQTADALAFNESSTNAATVTINTSRYTTGIPNTGFTTVSTQAVAAATDFFEPFLITAPTVVDLLAFEVTTAPASTATVHGAIYAATGDYQPTGAPLAAFGGVTVATGTTGVYNTQITAVTLQPGTYVLGFNSSVAFTARAMRRESALIHTLGANPVVLTTTAARTNAAFPNPSAGWNTRAASTVGRNTFALLRWRPA
jgi:hypothetical protein